jgi:hypothetical protein
MTYPLGVGPELSVRTGEQVFYFNNPIEVVENFCCIALVGYGTSFKNLNI